MPPKRVPVYGENAKPTGKTVRVTKEGVVYKQDQPVFNANPKPYWKLIPEADRAKGQ